MTAAWRRLEAELQRWPPGAASLWWRDDDAVAPSAALDRLLGLAVRPVALAVVPAGLDPALPGFLAGRPVDVLQHGFAHENREPAGSKRSELGPARPLAERRAALGRGRQMLTKAFGVRALPVLVPPWNRIEGGLADLLAGDGYVGLSAYGPRRGPAPAGLAVVNAHVDIIDWRGGRRFIGREATIELALTHLAARREGRADAAEPTGLLTHHLVMDDDAFDFVGEFLDRTGRHPSVQWRAARDIFPDDMGSSLR